MAAAGIVHHRLAAAELVDRLGDETGIPGIPRRLDLGVAIAARRCGLAHHPLIRRRDGRVVEQPTGLRRAATSQLDRRRARPFLPEEIPDWLGRSRVARKQWVT